MAEVSTDCVVPEDFDDERSLKNTFETGMKLYEYIDTGDEPTNSSAMQLSVKLAIDKFENATRQVSILGMFSRNESIEELSTETIQYLLLPALLGSLSLKICDRPRREVIDLAEVYFRDFLQRCKDYSITEIELPPISDGQATSSQARNQTEQQKLTSIVLSREAKIKRYKEQKELKEKLVNLKKAMDSQIIDDQTKREYFLTLIIDYVNQSLDELSSIELEKPILEYMAKHAGEVRPKTAPTRKPLKPIIITRDAIQKAVYGLGYPSIPSITIEEFYSQRVKEGTFPAPGISSSTPNTAIPTIDENVDEDPEKIRREQLRQEDDPEELERQRFLDEYRDEHKRGEGNRYNRS